MVVQCTLKVTNDRLEISDMAADAKCNHEDVVPSHDDCSSRGARRSSARLKLLQEKKSHQQPQKKRTLSPPPCHNLKVNKVSQTPSTPNHKKRKLGDEDAHPPGPTATPGPHHRHLDHDFHQTQDAHADADADAHGNPVPTERSASASVTETLRQFNKCYLHFVQEEEKRCGKLDDRQKNKASCPKENIAEDDTKRGSKRPDLKAITKAWIDVGHQFFSRAEMVVLGFHSHWLNGIDYIGQARRSDLGDYKLPLAVSIVLSGQYEDDLDNFEEIVYTGQGGNNLLGDKRQIKDQVMRLGNLGLKNCIEHSVPVRVVRGHKCTNSYVGKVYTYDGLYKVVNYWAEKGVSGFTVYKFRLKRLEGQPPLTTSQVHYTRSRVPDSIAEIRGLVCKDITGGQEDIPIPATNLVDDPPVPPTGFTYHKDMKFAKNVKLPLNASGCSCRGTCTDPGVCACAKLNGSDFPYVFRDGGRLIEPKAVVFECNPNCGCGPGCVNRISQRGLKYRLEVFRTPNRGWGVRCWDYIPSGAPICEYIGRLTKTDDIDSAAGNSYIFDIDCLQTMKGLDGRERRLRDVSLPVNLENDDDKMSESVPEFCIDAGSAGNVARFINHSCQPNLFVQCILSTHHDIKLARVVLIAADNIPPLKELTYDYGYALDSVAGPDGIIKQMPCYCGAADCRKRLF
ncbi:unnamed protein product [Coffea canephora]|uniref:Histone-lysine N-methyltransferase, H3 lysine-9 specific SUVH4 n=1 Tax=Coffea canephora TaxID=49390 RepID=A0A068V7Y8_COFCA|nr:unnamed protein product [Coffea canephora]